MRITNGLGTDFPVPESKAPARWSCGVSALDSALGGGFSHGRVHEIYTARACDAFAATGFVAALAAGMSGARGRALWLRSRTGVRRGGIFQAAGWLELGGRPENLLLGIVEDTAALLRAAADALRCAGLGVLVVESWGALREMDLTASRRLVLAAESSGVPLLLLRMDAAPVPSAAQTRWQVACAPSRALPGQAPGWPTFDIELLRQRAGPSGLRWRLEWDRDERNFRDTASLSGAVVPVSANRSRTDTGRDRHAA